MFLEISPELAAERGIQDGTLVRLTWDNDVPINESPSP
ncbi:hypothetical protein B4140_1299 [Bacillus amyloliquefaciens]|nr:hypothetical protein B4140_1299 [Bacillus amyloliquefaciens]